MKKLLSLLLIAILIAALAACGGNGDTPEETESGTAPATPPAAGDFSLARPFSVEEAAQINASINPRDVNLIQFQPPPSGNPRATFITSEGEITVVLYPEQAPLAVENFITHAQDGYFNGMSFYRVIDDFLIQSGAPQGEGAWGRSVFAADNEIHPDSYDPGFFASEFSLDLWNFRGALVMANAGIDRPDTNTSEFFIVQADFVSPGVLETMREGGFPQAVIDKYEEVGGVPGFDWRNTVFGMVIEGMDIVDIIAGGATDSFHTPYNPVIIISVSIQD